HVDDRLGGGCRLAVPGPLAEWALRPCLHLWRRNLTLDGDLRVGGDGQPCHTPPNDLDWLPGEKPGVVVLRCRFRHAAGRAPGEKDQWLRCEGHRDRARLALGPVLLHDPSTV